MAPSAPRRRSAATALLLVAVALPACRGDGGQAAAADSTLARDLTLANGAVTRPPLRDSLVLGGDTATTRPTPRLAPEVTPAPIARRSPARTPSATPSRAAPSSAAPREVAVRPAPRRPEPPVRRPPPPEPPTQTASDAPDPAPGSAAGAGTGRSLAAGTVLAGTLGQRVCSESNHPGDRFVATLGSDASGPAGVVLPAGTPLVLEVTRVAGDPPVAEFVVRGVSVDGDFMPVEADASPVSGEVERHEVVDKASSAKGNAAKGAIAGAILGQILGRNTKGTIIGAAGGAAAGAAMGRGKSHEEACVAGGARVQVRLTERLTVR